MTSQIVGVAGNLGSGKSTLARGLSTLFGWQVVPQTSYDRSYIDDLFQDPNRWSFEAQMAFLSHKARSIRDAAEWGAGIIVDRSIYEDIDVFARLFAQTARMDARAQHTYAAYAELVLSLVPRPAAIVYCACPPNECDRRLQNRPRPYQRLYPPDHLEALGKLYDAWTEEFSACPLFSLDTVAYDIRELHNLKLVANEIEEILSSEFASNQLDLFSPPPGDHAVRSDPILAPINQVRQAAVRTEWKHSARRFRVGTPSIYIAAPFTAIARDRQADGSAAGRSTGDLLDVPHHHGVIPAGAYRRALNRISRALKRKGYHAVLPHRDVNEWGMRSLTPAEVGADCERLVAECDLFLGILGVSYGSHVELGMAIGLGKPCVVIAFRNEEQTFIARAIRDSELAVGVELDGLDDVPDWIRSSRFGEALDQAARLALTLRSRR